jgi:hypothetical protein
MLVHGNGLNGVEQGARNAIRFEPFDYRNAVPIKVFEKYISGWTIDRGRTGASRCRRRHDAARRVVVAARPARREPAAAARRDAEHRGRRPALPALAVPPRRTAAVGDHRDEEFLGLDREERDKLMSSCAKTSMTDLRGVDNAGKPALLPPGLDWKPVGHTAVEAALIDQRKVAREEVCAVYQIPPPFLGLLDRATFNNITTLREVAYTDGLGPPLVLIEQTINAQLVRSLLREDDVYVEFDFAGVLRGDRLKEMQALREAIGIGLMTRNEGRSVLNMPQAPTRTA